MFHKLVYRIKQMFGLASAWRPGTQEDFIATVGDQLFFDSYAEALKYDDDMRVMYSQAEYIKRYNLSALIEGHCDPAEGTREYTLALAERRALWVKGYMVSYGVPADRIQTVSYGKERPAHITPGEQYAKYNRRTVTLLR